MYSYLSHFLHIWKGKSTKSKTTFLSNLVICFISIVPHLMKVTKAHKDNDIFVVIMHVVMFTGLHVGTQNGLQGWSACFCINYCINFQEMREYLNVVLFIPPLSLSNCVNEVQTDLDWRRRRSGGKKWLPLTSSQVQLLSAPKCVWQAEWNLTTNTEPQYKYPRKSLNH